MALKNLMVHLTQSERTPYRLQLAVALARKYDARIVGVFAQLGKPAQVGVVATWPSQEYRAARDASEARFRAATAGLRDAEWVDVNRGSESQVIEHVVAQARCFDLAVMGQYNEPGLSFAPPELCEEVVLNSGRPVLIVPYIGSFESIGSRPLIAWNGTRESTRAMNDALPLIEGCGEVLVFSAGQQAGGDPHADVRRHLGTHGFQVRSELEVLDEEVSVMDALLNRTSDLGVDLIVMGANALVRRPFLSQWTGTRYILRHMTVPVLMSN